MLRDCKITFASYRTDNVHRGCSCHFLFLRMVLENILEVFLVEREYSCWPFHVAAIPNSATCSSLGPCDPSRWFVEVLAFMGLCFLLAHVMRLGGLFLLTSFVHEELLQEKQASLRHHQIRLRHGVVGSPIGIEPRHSICDGLVNH